jgi:bifunctional DNA-binding transcriptional regulator/antitoxin component of YhaV-PrlF toxin-antitoxin module
VRERLGLAPGAEVEFVEEGGAVIVRRAASRAGRGARLVARVAGRRRGQGLSTDEVLALTRGPA